MYFSSILLAEPFLKTFPLGITLNKPVVSVVPSELTHKMMQLHVVVNYYMHMDNKFFSSSNHRQEAVVSFQHGS